MRRLLFGSTGFLGSAFTGITADRINIFDYHAIIAQLKKHKPHVVLNCIVNRDRNKSYDELFAVNALFPTLLATACSSLGVKLIHFSTIYSGNYDGYTQTKAESEKIVLRHSQHCVIRLPVLFDFKHNDCFFSLVVNRLLNLKQIEVYKNEFINPLFVDDVVDFVDAEKNLCGEIDLTGSTYINREDLVSFIGNKVGIKPSITSIYRKPPSIRLRNQKIIFGSIERKITKCLESVSLLHS